MPQHQDFDFKPSSRLEAVAQQAEEKEGNCEHPQSCSDSPAIANPMDGVFGTDTSILTQVRHVTSWKHISMMSCSDADPALARSYDQRDEQKHLLFPRRHGDPGGSWRQRIVPPRGQSCLTACSPGLRLDRLFLQCMAFAIKSDRRLEEVFGSEDWCSR